MQAELFAEHWRELKGRLKERWPVLTDEEIELAKGHPDMLVGQLQEHYGWTRQQAEAEYAAFAEQLQPSSRW
jgi:uncharacterized protein YjbJ (UPF0337 family)